MKVRTAQKSEYKIIADFQLKMAFETENLTLNKQVVEKGVQAVLNDCSKGAYYVVEADGHIIGSLLTTFEWSDWRNSTIVWIQSVYVVPEYRKQGVFKNLYEYIKNVVNASDEYSGIRLYVDKSNIKAQAVYEAVGMNGQHYTTFEWMKE